MTNFAKIILQYGDDAVIYTGDTAAEVKCFIQPVITKSQKMTWKEITPLGEKNTARYYGFFPPDTSFGNGAYISCQGKDYEILRAEEYTVEKQVSHWETIMELREDACDG